jgi:hypothetical protein
VDLTEFLNAQHFTVHEQPYYSCAGSRTEPYGDLEWGEGACDCRLAERKARALREVEASRLILAEHGQVHSKVRRVLRKHGPRVVGMVGWQGY